MADTERLLSSKSVYEQYEIRIEDNDELHCMDLIWRVMKRHLFEKTDSKTAGEAAKRIVNWLQEKMAYPEQDKTEG